MPRLCLIYKSKSFIKYHAASLTQIYCNIIILVYTKCKQVLKESCMTQREFIDKLKNALSGKVSAGTVQENVNYYEQYFLSELRRGRSEEDICASLGSPQLIAKSILEAEKFQSGSTEDTYSGKVHEEKDYRSSTTRWTDNVRSFHIPGWLMLLLAAGLFFTVISVVLTIFSALAPIIVPICIVLFIVHIFKNNFG